MWVPFDIFTFPHYLFGVALGWAGVRSPILVVTLALAWEAVEMGLGDVLPFGRDPDVLNSMVDVVVAVVGWRCAPRPAE